MGLNYASVSGNLTREPELRSTPSGMQILDIGLAFNDRRRDPQTGQWEDVPNYISAVIFGNRAEALSRILTKGMHVAVQGKLRWSSWEDKTSGQKRSKIEIIADEVDIMSQRQGGGYSQQMPAAAPQMPQNAPQMPQGYASAAQPQMAPQMPSQPPVQQQFPQQQFQQQPSTVYDEDIPF